MWGKEIHPAFHCGIDATGRALLNSLVNRKDFRRLREDGDISWQM